jgi:hypothetical protein
LKEVSGLDGSLAAQPDSIIGEPPSPVSIFGYIRSFQ